MNQQLFEKGLKAFEDAAAKDPEPEGDRTQPRRGPAEPAAHRRSESRCLRRRPKTIPTMPHAWYNLGLFYKNSSIPEKAVESFHHVTEIDPNDADTWYFLGSTYAQLKQFPEALDAFEHALKIDPLHASAQFGLSRAYQQSGRSRQSPRKSEEIPVHHAEQTGRADQPGLWRAGKVFAGGRVADRAAEGPAADSGEVCGCDERGGNCRGRG